jgi:hypothetical protein
MPAFSVATDVDLACFDEALPCRDNQDWCRGRTLYSKLGGQESFCFTAANKKGGNEDCRSSD